MHSFKYLAILVLAFGFLHVRADDPQPGQQVEMKLELSGGGSISYLLYLPNDYGDAAQHPVMLFLHGRGESYGPLSLVKKWGPPRLVERGEELPYILVSPQCPGESRWNAPEQQQALVQLLDHVAGRFKADEDRVYLTGLSMGGYGSWTLAAKHPERFAAVIPVCGGGNPDDAGSLKTLPIWVFHGTEDSAVPFQRSVDMVDAIKQAGGTRIRFTSLENVGHNCWSATYATPEIYQWLNEHKRAGAQ